ncbi:substrate-binding domain-containing protein [Rhizobium lusitanum]|uniref:Substrate-binding domain-containing protein n=1 Tax=Rhizobium lusitanum TaxID=293958 RepID=A0A6L9ULG9_9HYPH|nr:LacI family DNA-binding transcriptional regulator [Rhizobium lusitanum]NEI74947.1 substrate-binding domain-containing protein [Rhizobium lusitanum]
MKKKRVTSTDVARKAGVSQSAVSRTFSPWPTQSGVSAEIREKVLRAAKELGYQPNAIARSLITQRSRMVGVLFSYLDNPFYARALELLCHGLQARGYHALVFMMSNTLQDTDSTVSDILQYQVDGLLTASVELSSKICIECAERGIPVVMFNRTQDDPTLSAVTTDNVGGGRLAAKALLDAGCERIAILAGWDGASTSRDREFGFRAELNTRGIELFERANGNFNLEDTTQAVRRLFKDKLPAERPDALFVVNDYMAIRAMDVIRNEAGLRIPEDVSVVGFDDITTAAQPTYALTTVRQPINRMVEASLRMLFEQIEDPSAQPEHMMLGAQLVERGSVGSKFTS